MSWKTRKLDSQHFQKIKNLFHPPRYVKYSNIVELTTPSDARRAKDKLWSEYNSTSNRAKKLRIKRVLVEAANRAKVSSNNPNFSSKERQEFSEIEQIYRQAYYHMHIPPKKNSLVIPL